MNLDESSYFENRKSRAKEIFEKQKAIYCPFFQTNVILNSDGFNHLQFKGNRMPRNTEEQLLKFSLLPLALEVVRKSGTIQEYRKILTPFGEKSEKGFAKMKEVEYWGLIAIVGENKIKIKAILKRIGTGNITFWSVMPHAKLKNQKLAHVEIEDE